jgi:hypothetical protein
MGAMALFVMYAGKDFFAAIRFQQLLQVILAFSDIAEFHLFGKILTGIKIPGFGQNQIQFSCITGH